MSNELESYRQFWNLLRVAQAASDEQDRFDPNDDVPGSRERWYHLICEQNRTALDLVEHCRVHFTDLEKNLLRWRDAFNIDIVDIERFAFNTDIDVDKDPSSA